MNMRMQILLVKIEKGIYEIPIEILGPAINSNLG